jgi:glycosyltransferase involved in cell wall biosynthesis
METNTHAPLKVLLAAPHFPPTRIGGAELFAYRIARGLVARGHVVQVVCAESVDDAASNGALRGSDEVYDGIPVRRLYYNQRALSETRRATFASPLIEAQLGAWLAQNRVDLVHLVSGYLLGIAPLRAARRFGIPTVVTLNDFWFLCPTINFLRGDGSLCAGPSALECARCLYDAQRRFRYVDQRAPQLMRGFWQFAREHPQLGARFDLPQRLEMLDERRAQLRDALNAADVIAPITHFLANRFAAQGFDAARFMVTPLAGPPQIDHAPTRADADEIHFGYLGQIAPIKGVDVLVRAFRQLKRTLRSPGAMRTRGWCRFSPPLTPLLCPLPAMKIHRRCCSKPSPRAVP